MESGKDISQQKKLKLYPLGFKRLNESTMPDNLKPFINRYKEIAFDRGMLLNEEKDTLERRSSFYKLRTSSKKLIRKISDKSIQSAKINDFIEMLETLARIDLYASRNGLELTFDVAIELHRLHDWIKENFNSSDKKQLEIDLENSTGSKREKLNIFAMMINNDYTPPLYFYASYAIYSASKQNKPLEVDKLPNEIKLSDEIKKLTNKKDKRHADDQIFKNFTDNFKKLEGLVKPCRNSFTLIFKDKRKTVKFEQYEEIMELSIQLLKHPEADASSKEKLCKIILFCQIKMNKLLSTDFREVLSDQQKKYKLVRELQTKIPYLKMGRDYVDNSTLNEERFIADSLKEGSYEITILKGGNNNVYIIGDTLNGVRVGLRASPKNDERDCSDPYRILPRSGINPLGLTGPFGQRYLILSGPSDEMTDKEEFRNFEFMEVIGGGNLQKYFDVLHTEIENYRKQDLKNFDKDIYEKKKKSFQLELIYFIKQLVWLVSDLKEKKLCYPDLKLSNLLIKEGNVNPSIKRASNNASDTMKCLRISDLKTLLDSAKTENGRYHGDDIQLSKGYSTPRACRTDKEKRRYYLLDLIVLETLVFNVYKLITNKNLVQNYSELPDDNSPAKKMALTEEWKSSEDKLTQAQLEQLQHEDIYKHFAFEGALGDTIKRIYQLLVQMMTDPNLLEAIFNGEEIIVNKLEDLHLKLDKLCDNEQLIEQLADVKNQTEKLSKETTPS